MKTKRILAGFLAGAIAVSGLSFSAFAEEEAEEIFDVEEEAAGEVAINEKNFPDARFRKYISVEFDSDGNGVLSQTEINSVVAMNCPLRGIASLSGIEYFTKLSWLACFENELTSLDVSKNTALTYLDCYKNELTSLNVSNNASLEYLYCSSNQLTSLDVSGYTALTTLECNYNKLTSLDASGCTALKELKCYINRLTSLDVSGCTALTTLYCGDNSLTSLDVSGCTAVKEINCNNNQLTSLDVSGCTALIELDCEYNKLISIDVSKNTALITLYCEENQLTSLDVSKNTALKDLGCYNNRLTSLDVSNNIALEYIGCMSNQLTSLDVSNNTALTMLGCYDNQLTSLDVSKNTALKNLGCSNNRLTSLDVSNNTALEYLSCEKNQLTLIDLNNNPALNKINSIDKTITIYGKAGSYAEKYAKENGIKFIVGSAPAKSENPAPSQPATVKSAANMLGATVMCSKVDGATKYRLFYTTDNGKNYTKVGDNKTRKWEVTGLKAGVEYKFLVLASDGKKWSAYKKGDCYAAVTPSPTVKATAGKAKAVVTCSAVSGAKKYRLFYTTDNGKSYKKVGDNTTRKWTVTGLKSGVTYKFLVLAYDGKKWSAYKKGDCYAAVVPK